MAKKVNLPSGLKIVVVEGLRYILGLGSQKELFRLADGDNHKVCVVLEKYKTRLFTSFSNYNEFLNYYENFKGQRCFYTIDRSISVESDTSLLHFDIEWYCEKPDRSYSSKLAKIRKAIQSSLPCDKEVEIVHEHLSR